MKHLVWIAAFLAFAACKKSNDSGASSKAAGDGAACEAAIGKAVAALPAGANPQAQSVQPRLKAALVTRCTEDKWPAEVIQCYESATGMQGMKACREKLPPEARDKAIADIQRAMMLGMAGGGAHGMPPAGGSANNLPNAIKRPPGMGGGSDAAGSAAPGGEAGSAAAPAPGSVGGAREAAPKE